MGNGLDWAIGYVLEPVGVSSAFWAHRNRQLHDGACELDEAVPEVKAYQDKMMGTVEELEKRDLGWCRML